MSGLATLVGVGAPRPRPRFDVGGAQPISTARSGACTAEPTIDSLFAVGLKITAARARVDGQAGARLDRVVEDLDAMIAELRSRVV